MRLVEDTSNRRDPAAILLNAKASDVQNQQKLFGTIVGLRVAMQPVLAAVNRLPANKFALDFMCGQSSDVAETCEDVAAEADKLFASLLVLQDKMWDHIDNETESGLEGDDTDDDESSDEKETDIDEPPSDNNLWEVRKRKFKSSTSQPEQELVKRLAKRQKKINEYCLAQADIWKSHCQPAAQRSFKALDQSISWQVKFALNDAARALAKSSLPVSQANVIGSEWEVPRVTPAIEAKIPNMSTALRNSLSFERYDDKELYVSLLNSAVRGSAAKASDMQHSGVDDRSALNDLEKLREMRLRSKELQAKKNVDRKASKGRKIRYKEIEKLVSFMAPEPRLRTLDPDVAARLVENAFKQDAI